MAHSQLLNWTKLLYDTAQCLKTTKNIFCFINKWFAVKMASVDLLRFACNISKNEVIFQHCDMACRILKWARNDWNLRKSNRRSYSQTDFTLEMSPSLGRSSVRVRLVWKYNSRKLQQHLSFCFHYSFCLGDHKRKHQQPLKQHLTKKARPHRRIGKLFCFVFSYHIYIVHFFVKVEMKQNQSQKSIKKSHFTT